MKPRFLLDEHISRAIQRQLRRLEPQIEILMMGDPDAPPKGILDPELLIWLEANHYSLITENRSTMPLHLVEHYEAGRHIPGILWIRPNASLGRIIEELYLIWAASTAEEYQDRTLFIPW
jgi:hypothetical protein